MIVFFVLIGWKESDALNSKLEEKNISLNMPPRLADKGQFTEEEVEQTQTIAALRIHVSTCNFV